MLVLLSKCSIHRSFMEVNVLSTDAAATSDFLQNTVNCVDFRDPLQPVLQSPSLGHIQCIHSPVDRGRRLLSLLRPQLLGLARAGLHGLHIFIGDLRAAGRQAGDSGRRLCYLLGSLLCLEIME